MQEYVLFAQVPTGSHDRVIDVLQRVVGHPLVPIREQQLFYEPKQAKAPASSKKQPQQTNSKEPQRLIHKLLRSVDIDGGDAQNGPWKLREESPALAGITNVIARPVQEDEISDAELQKFRGATSASNRWFR
jgi:hypothetical protein